MKVQSYPNTSRRRYTSGHCFLLGVKEELCTVWEYRKPRKKVRLASERVHYFSMNTEVGGSVNFIIYVMYSTNTHEL